MTDEVKISTEEGAESKKADAAQKRKRVNRIKTAILITIIILFLLPTILCIIFGLQLSKLQRQVDKLLSTYSIDTEEKERKGIGGKYAYASTDEDAIKYIEDQEDDSINNEDSGILNETDTIDDAGIQGEDDNTINPGTQEETDTTVNPDTQEESDTADNPDIQNETETNENSDMQEKTGNTDNPDTQQGTGTGEKPGTKEQTDPEKNTDDSANQENSTSDSTERYRDPDGIYYDKKVYLTFDDGPTKNTDKILDILADYDVKATFFVVGREDEKSLERYKRIVDEGHVLAIHSYSHKYSYIYESLENFDKDFTKLWNLLYDTTGYTPTLYRFPGGSMGFLSRSEMKEYVHYLDEKGMTYYDWNVVNGDAEGIDYTKKQMIDNVLNGVAKKKTAIVLMHDGEGKDKTVAILPTILDALITGGAEVLPLDKDVPLIQQIKASSLK